MSISAIGMIVCASLILLLRDWRLTLPILALHYLCLAAFLVRQGLITADLHVAGIGIGTPIIAKCIAGGAATLILAVTALTFSRDYGLEHLDEFSLTELRRAARRAQQQAARPFRPTDYLLPAVTLLLVALASIALPLLYPVGGPQVDLVWYWLGLSGLFTLAIAGDLLKAGNGLLLIVSSADLLYTSAASSLQVFPLLLIDVTTIVLALTIAYLSGLMYARLKTLDLESLFQ